MIEIKEYYGNLVEKISVKKDPYFFFEMETGGTVLILWSKHKIHVRCKAKQWDHFLIQLAYSQVYKMFLKFIKILTSGKS